MKTKIVDQAIQAAKYLEYAKLKSEIESCEQRLSRLFAEMSEKDMVRLSKEEAEDEDVTAVYQVEA